jgi:chromosome segregation and condensation protein ScpB
MLKISLETEKKWRKKIKMYTKQYIHAYTKYSENMKYSKAKIRILTVLEMKILI